MYYRGLIHLLKAQNPAKFSTKDMQQLETRDEQVLKLGVARFYSLVKCPILVTESKSEDIPELEFLKMTATTWLSKRKVARL